jgi:hypothetical protein
MEEWKMSVGRDQRVRDRFVRSVNSNLVPRLFPLFEERPWSGLVT